MGTSWEHVWTLGSIWRTIGGLRRAFGRSLGTFGAHLGVIGGFQRASWGSLGAFGAHLEELRATSGVIREPLGKLWGAFWVPFGGHFEVVQNDAKRGRTSDPKAVKKDGSKSTALSILNEKLASKMHNRKTYEKSVY